MGTPTNARAVCSLPSIPYFDCDFDPCVFTLEALKDITISFSPRCWLFHEPFSRVSLRSIGFLSHRPLNSRCAAFSELSHFQATFQHVCTQAKAEELHPVLEGLLSFEPKFFFPPPRSSPPWRDIPRKVRKISSLTAPEELCPLSLLL